MHYLTCTDDATIEQYHKHPKHQEFVERNKASWAPGVLVLNANLDK